MTSPAKLNEAPSPQPPNLKVEVEAVDNSRTSLMDPLMVDPSRNNVLKNDLSKGSNANSRADKEINFTDKLTNTRKENRILNH